VEPASRKDIGLFPDQRDNRAWLAPYYVGTRVLNLFCYTGAFSVHALVHGAAEVVSVDLSKVYLDQLEENLVLNGLEGGHEAVPQDALKVLDRFRRQGRVFDRIILDPPGHSHSAEGDWSGEQDYARLVAAAARVCAPGGWLIASSNLGSVSPRQFQGALVDGLRKASCQGRVIHTGGQAADFPSALHFPEGTFLKFVVIEVQCA
jgi:23S rRNA (cytosine1962-C5)-methyltransferase